MPRQASPCYELVIRYSPLHLVSDRSHKDDKKTNPTLDESRPRTFGSRVFRESFWDTVGGLADSLIDITHTFETAVTPEGLVQRPERRIDSSSDDEYRRFKVQIKWVADVDLEAVMKFCRANEASPSGEEECLTGLMATNVLLRDIPSKRYTQVGATGNRFFSMDGAVPIGQGGIVCKGFMQSFRYSNSGFPLLNLDVGFSAFLASGPALEIIAQILNRGAGSRGREGYHGGIQRPGPEVDKMSEQELKIVKNKLRGAKFKVTHRQSTRLHTVMSITTKAADGIFFELQARDDQPSRTVSIPQYYQEAYGSPVTKPRLPCIQYGKRAFIPLEFVHLADWNSLPPTKLSPEQTAEMMKASAMRPPDRCQAVKNWRSELAYESQPKIDRWGLKVNHELVKLQARVLPPPRVLYANNVDARAFDGSWTLKGKRFIRNASKPLKSWAIVSYDRYFDESDMARYIDYLCRVLRERGVVIANDKPIRVGPLNPTVAKNIKGGLQDAARESYRATKCDPQLILVVLPGRDLWVYEAIKTSSFNDLKQPVPMQCMQAAKIKMDRGLAAYTDNLVMKIQVKRYRQLRAQADAVQAKLGGQTHQVPLTELPGMIRGKTMLLGVDIGHPPNKDRFASAPTVACSIATYNADCDAFSAQIRLQIGRDERIADFSTMVESHLLIYSKKNGGSFPERILIFRDGISEGQYAAALQYEHNAVLTACSKIKSGYRPRILICVCAKRHNTRFFGEDKDVDRSGNLPSGTVVDRTVTHPYAFDFFLQAHQGRVGTARPTHYICLLDELAITPDQLQQLVNSLCYSFSRCTRSVSLVPVCYIADLVCQKARLIANDPNASSAPSVSSAGENPPNRSNGDLDVMQVQKVLSRNPELADVAWWM